MKHHVYPRHYRQPAYPTRLCVLAKPELLKKHVPKAWLANPKLAGLAVFFLAASAKAEDTGPTTPRPEPGRERGAAVVAPIFEHGEGRGSTGCVVVSPPVFLSEEEALQAIAEELKSHGIELSLKAVEWKDVLIAPREREVHVKGNEDAFKGKEQIVEIPGKAIPLTVNGIETTHNIAVKFISKKEYEALGGISGGHARVVNDDDLSKQGFMGSSVSRYNFKEVAQRVAGKVKDGRKEKAFFGAFYDPMMQQVISGGKDAQKIQDEKERPKTHAELWKEAEAQARTQALELLRAQVKDFVDWLKAQGAI